MCIKKWLHLSDSGEPAWNVRIRTAIAHAGRGELPYEVDVLGYSITLKLRMLSRSLNRLNEQCRKLFERARDHDARHIYSAENPKGGEAFKIDNDLQYELMLDVESLLFELDSTCEFITKFLGGVYDHLGIQHTKKNLGQDIGKIIAREDGDNSWYTLLSKERNFYIHEGAPYHAIDVSGDTYDLIIMKDNLENFDDVTKYTTLSELDRVVKGLDHGARVIRDHILDLYSIAAGSSRRRDGEARRTG